MHEQKIKPKDIIERLPSTDLHEGDVLVITTGEGENAWTYHFVVEVTGNWPSGRLQATAPDGSQTSEEQFSLHGAGNWTTPQENPVQKQLGLAFTSYFTDIYLGGHMIGRFEGQEDRAVFDNPGQQITSITITRA